MLDIHDRRGKSGAHQRIADIVHIDEAADMHMPGIDIRSGAQFFQRIRPEGTEHDKAVRLQYTVHLAECQVEIVAPLDGEVGPKQIQALRCERQMFDIATDADP